MEITERKIKGVFEVSLKPILDKRGFFMRTFDDFIFESKSIELRVFVLKFVGIINVEDVPKLLNESFICIDIYKKIIL